MSVTGLNGDAMLVQHKQDSFQTIYQLMKLPIHGHQNPDKSEEQHCQAVKFERGHGQIHFQNCAEIKVKKEPCLET